MAGEDPHVDIGRLRFQVILATRTQTPTEDEANPGITEAIEDQVRVWADIQPVGALTFWGGEQVDGPISHRIFMRWHDYLDQTKVIIRVSARTDRRYRPEIYRVRRIKMLGGRQRFALVEAELESIR